MHILLTENEYVGGAVRVNYVDRNDTVHYREQIEVEVVIMLCTFCDLEYPDSTHLDTFRIWRCSCVYIGIMFD